ncbi:hypothetical protein LINPERPRIM_LOCUS37252 [Linum perenne]
MSTSASAKRGGGSGGWRSSSPVVRGAVVGGAVGGAPVRNSEGRRWLGHRPLGRGGIIILAGLDSCLFLSLVVLYADNGCGYFDWVDDKVAALNEKIALVNSLNDRISLVSIVQQLENKEQQLKSENYDLQSTLTQSMRNPIGLSSNEDCSRLNTFKYNLQSEIETLKKRVALLENITGGPK